jgi:HK97 gp10 family phage protein
MAIYSKDIVGLDELIKDLQGFGEKAIQLLKPAADEAGEIVLTKAKAKVNVSDEIAKHAHLREVLKLVKSRVKKGECKYSNKITFPKSAAYAVPLELGHRLVRNGKKIGTVKEKPFLRPAADESREKVENIFINAMDRALKELGDK